MNSENPFESPLVDPIREYDYSEYEQPTLSEVLFSFQGRIPRRVYWGGTIATTLVFYIIIFIPMIVLGEDSLIPIILILAALIPMVWVSLALQIKRWQDRNKSGWWVLINFVPYIGSIWTLIECGCLRGTEGPNQFGPDPT